MHKFDSTLMGLTMALTQIARSYVSAANKVAGSFHLSHATAWPVLIISRMGDGIRPGVVADALGLEPPSLVRVIEQLVETGLIERRDDTSDRRAKTLHLTAAGHACAAQLEDALLPFRRKLFEHVDHADIEACVRTLGSLSVAIGEFEAAQMETVRRRDRIG
jgi:MarR family transcriptional regulator for hemolysin